MKKTNKIKKFLIITLYILLALLIITASAYISSYYYLIHEAKKQSKLLDNISINQDLIVEGESLSNDETVAGTDNSTETEIVVHKTERMLKIEELQKENPDIIGWIEIEGTNINYPVLQGTDNNFYVSHNYKKERNISGAIFLDKDYVWDPPSSNLLIYGHNNQNGTMFEDLLKYRNKNFYDAHPVIHFTTNSEDAYYEIISAFPSQVYYKSQTDVFKYYYFVNAHNEKEFYEYVRNVKNSGLYDTGKTAEFGDQLMTLSTCAYHTKDGRFVVVAKRIEN